MPRLLGVRLAGGWLGWLAFAAVFAITTAGVASGPVFLEGVGDALASDALEDGPPVESTVRLRADVSFFGGSFREAAAELESALVDIDLLDLDSTTLAVGATRTALSSEAASLRSDVRLVYRDGAIDSLTVVAGPSGPGVWLGERAASDLGVTPGDEVSITDPEWNITTRVIDDHVFWIVSNFLGCSIKSRFDNLIGHRLRGLFLATPNAAKASEKKKSEKFHSEYPVSLV